MSSKSFANLRAKEFGLEYIKLKVAYEKNTFMNLCYSAKLEGSYIPATISGYLAVSSPLIFTLEHGDTLCIAG